MLNILNVMRIKIYIFYKNNAKYNLMTNEKYFCHFMLLRYFEYAKLLYEVHILCFNVIYNKDGWQLISSTSNRILG